MLAEPVLSLAVSVAAERGVQGVLDTIVRGLAAQPFIALVRIWLALAGDVCDSCFLRTSCRNQTECLHLMASAGNPSNSPGEDWTFLQGHFRRIPLNSSKVGEVGTTEIPILIKDFAPENDWIVRPDWARREGIRSFVGHPLVFQGKNLGVLALFSRECLSEQDSAWLGIFAKQAAVAIANARAFEEIARLRRQLELENAYLHENIEDRKRAEEELQRSAFYLDEGQRLAHSGSWSFAPSGICDYWSQELYHILGFDATKGIPTIADYLNIVHPEDRKIVEGTIERMVAEVIGCDLKTRIIRPDGELRVIRCVGRPVGENGAVTRFIGTLMDITEQERMTQELRQIIDSIPQLIGALNTDGKIQYVNESVLEYSGLTSEDVDADNFRSRLFHPDDIERLEEERQHYLKEGQPFQLEMRTRGKDGLYRWFLIHYKPLRDQNGRIVRWYATGTDIDDRKRDEELLKKETLALREELNRTSMFEEIVGSSEVLRAVLRQITKVAPTDSTVLITGETGTGKELIARAIHKRSGRSARAFVSVNCAAIPQSLIASELFGHEKGAFTGALQRRLGRFELAEGGTIFLDEIGDLPADTQNTLLRVLQEREFERVGGTETIRANVRVIAATNSDLKIAMAEGHFRSDLFYRLNVFPIEVPPLRDRKEDVPMLVEYFIDRYASKAGKKIRSINKTSLQLLQSYSWPGNIRELQNVIERAVIVCETESLVIGENWLSLNRIKTPLLSRPLSEELIAREKERIEAALAETNGRVSGPLGAATKLGVPRSTLDSKIRSLKINTHRFKTV
jgi:PAS domain S-box-containing protein